VKLLAKVSAVAVFAAQVAALNPKYHLLWALAFENKQRLVTKKRMNLFRIIYKITTK
jgi:hypothetical protein